MSTDDEAARKARANAIRRGRDRFNSGSPSPDSGAAADAPDAPCENDEKEKQDGKAGGPNYSAWIDKKMRDKKMRDDPR